MPNFTSQLCGDIASYGWLLVQDGIIQKSSKKSWTSGKAQKWPTAKAAWAIFSTDSYLPEMLVSVYSVMVKSVSCCCVHGTWVSLI